MRAIKIFLAIFFSIALASCGSGGGGAAPSAKPTTVTGTTATGKPLGNAQITLTDSKGVSKTATSSVTGKYTINVTGLTAPFVVKATGLQGTVSVTLVSVEDTVVKSSTNVINITPWTTAISAMLSSTGFAKDLDAVKDQATIISSLTTVDNYTKTLLAPTLTAAGLSTTAGPITTPFVADGTGYDSIYDNLLIGETSKGTIFMGPRCTPQIVTINGHCTEYSDPGDQTTTNPNLCGFDIATGAGIPCDPSQPITAQPSVALPILGPNDVAGGFAISGPGVHFGPADTPPPPNPLNLPICANGATNYPTCTLHTCANGATNYPTCTLTQTTPTSGNYTGTCTVTVSSVTCCSGGQCSTVPGTSTQAPFGPFSVASGTSLSQFTSNVCSSVNAAFSGCASSTCNSSSSSSTSAAFSASCTIPAVTGCTGGNITETCSVSHQ